MEKWDTGCIPLLFMDKQDFLEKYTDYYYSFLYDDMLDNTSKTYMNVVPRQTGTTTSLILYELYKLTQSDEPYTILHIENTSILSMYYMKEFEIYLMRYTSIYNSVGTKEVHYTFRNSTYKIYVDNILKGKILITVPTNDYHKLYRYDEIVYDDPFMFGQNNFDEHFYYSSQRSQKETIIHTSHSIAGICIENIYPYVKFTPYYLFLHMNLFEFQKHMLNILGEDKFEELCLMKGKYYGRFKPG